MHVLQSKHNILRPEEANILFEKFKINKSQLPKIKKSDVMLPPEAKIGDIIKIERRAKEGTAPYYRVVIG